MRQLIPGSTHTHTKKSTHTHTKKSTPTHRKQDAHTPTATHTHTHTKGHTPMRHTPHIKLPTRPEQTHNDKLETRYAPIKESRTERACLEYYTHVKI